MNELAATRVEEEDDIVIEVRPNKGYREVWGNNRTKGIEWYVGRALSDESLDLIVRLVTPPAPMGSKEKPCPIR